MPSLQPIGEFLAALGARTPAPASGAATALTAAMAAALAELAARFAGDEEAAARANALVARLERLADEDSEAYAAFMAERTPATRRRTIEVPEEVAACADEAAAIGERLAATLSSAVAGDAEAAAALGHAAAAVARRLAALNAA
jgi:formiminotetrahydrofolate cyclodeaminase